MLSRFTGASRELRDAVVVNPYDVEELAEAIRFALELDPGERETRMRRMRQVLRKSNIYGWAADLIKELAEIRIEPSAPEQDYQPGQSEISARGTLPQS